MEQRKILVSPENLVSAEKLVGGGGLIVMSCSAILYHPKIFFAPGANSRETSAIAST